VKAFQYNAVNGASEQQHHSKIHLVLISQELDNPYWRVIEYGARKAAEERGVVLEYIGPVQAGSAEQMKMFEMAIASKIDGILTQGLQEPEFIPIINQAMEKGIPVITVDSDAVTSNRIAYIGTDNYAAGYMLGKALIQETSGTANVGIVTGLFGAVNLKERVRGFLDAVKREDGIRILDMKESKITRIGAASAAYSLASTYPELDAFVGTSALDGVGIVQMMNDDKNSYAPIIPRDKHISVIAFDDLPETMDWIDKGMIDATIVQQPYQMGVKGVELLLDYIAGKKIVTVYNTDAKIVRKADRSENLGAGK